MKSIKTISSIVAILLMVGCSSQQVKPKVKNQSNLAEVKERMSKILFDHVDSDRSSKISEDEFMVYQKEKSELQERRQIDRMIESCDKNGDKQISLDEIPQGDPMMPRVVTAYEPYIRPCFIDKNRFTRQDVNHDNILTFDELALKRPIPDYPYPVEVAVPADNSKEREIFLKDKYSSCDKNGDGKLTLNEATTKKCRIPSEEFGNADSNNDGFLTLQEIMDIAKEQDDKRRVAHNARPVIPTSAPKEIQLMMSMSKCDMDRDGKLSESEIISENCGFSKEDLKENDHNKDGYFSQKDMALMHLLRQFKEMDKNRDKMLDFDEFKRNGREF